MDIKSALIFTAGVVVGGAISAFATYKIADKKAEKRIEEEVASVKATFKARKPLDISKVKTAENIETKVAPKKVDPAKPAMNAYSSLAKQYEATATIEEKEPAKSNDLSGIEEISVNEYGSMSDGGYECKELMLYADGVLADDNYEVVDNPGFGNLSELFSKSGEDELYFRDHDDEIDYAVYRSDKTFVEDLNDDKSRKRLPNHKG